MFLNISTACLRRRNHNIQLIRRLLNSAATSSFPKQQEDEVLSESQTKVVRSELNGVSLVRAGPGSGKTKVLTSRIKFMVTEGNITSRQIVAITFTNKAAKEMKDRIKRWAGLNENSFNISTFHSFCIRLLRQHAVHLPNLKPPYSAALNSRFGIYDGDEVSTFYGFVLLSFAYLQVSE